MSTPSTSSPIAADPTSGANPKRKKALTGLALVVALGLAYGGLTWVTNRHQDQTDNADVQGNVLPITPQIRGTVTALLAADPRLF